MADILTPRPGLDRRLDPSARRVAVLIGSVALHGAVFIALATRVVDPPDRVPGAFAGGPVYVELEPMPRIEGRSRPTASPSSAPASPPASIDAAAPLPPGASVGDAPALSPDPPAPPVAAQPPGSGLDARIAEALRRGVAGCRMMAGRLDPVEQADCDRAFAQAVVGVAPIAGTGNPDRDARFAAAGAQALADYERRRAPLKPNSRAQPCPHGTNMMGECPVRVIVPLYSKRFIIDPEVP